VEEETGYAASVVGSDLWESASLDYPGREELYMDQEDEFEPVIFFTTLIKKKIKFSSYIRKFRREQLQSHIYD
jgi:hypothetical protein